MDDIRILPSIRSVEPDSWNACFKGEIEDFGYLLAIEESHLEGFEWLYATAWSGETLVAAMPAFLTDYSIDTMIDGAGRKVTDVIASVFPNLLTLKLACLGSPLTEYGMIGFHPCIPDEEKITLLGRLVKAFEEEAGRHRHLLFGIKDISAGHAPLWERILLPFGYKRAGGLPVATLDIAFSSMDQYFERLSYATRKNMRRKLRWLNQIRVEHRHETIDDVLPDLMRLYRDTHARAEMKFEELTPDFFCNILRLMPGRAFFSLYYAGEELLGANLLIQNGDTLLDKFFMMDGARGRDYNLYFLSWFINVDYCIDKGLKRYQSGQAAYENKLRLGSTLTQTTMYFRHRNMLIQGALKLVAPLLAPDNELQKVA